MENGRVQMHKVGRQVSVIDTVLEELIDTKNSMQTKLDDCQQDLLRVLDYLETEHPAVYEEVQRIRLFNKIIA